MSKPHTYAEATPEQLDWIHCHARVGDTAVIRSPQHQSQNVSSGRVVRTLNVVEVGIQNEGGYPFNIRLEDGSIVGMFPHHDGTTKHMVCPRDQERAEFDILRKFIEAIREQQEDYADDVLLDLRIAVDRVFMCDGKCGIRYTVVDVNSCDHLCGVVKEESSVAVGFVPGTEDGWEEDEPDVQDSQTNYEIGGVYVTSAFWDTSPTGDVTRLQ